MNCDGAVNYGDVNPFVLALHNPVGYAEAHPNCSISKADVNNDGQVNYADVNPFVDQLTGVTRAAMEWVEIDLNTEQVERGLRVSLDASSSSPDAAWFFWDFGDGTYGADASVPTDLHGFDQDRTITLTVYNADWTDWGTVSKTIHVRSVMRLLDTGPAVAESAQDMAVDGSVAWVCHSAGTLSAFDVSDPANVEQLTRVSAPAGCGIAAANGLLFLTANGSGLHIYRSTIPPTHITTYNTYATDGQSVLDVVAAGNVAYVSAGPAGFKVLDVSVPSSPQLVGSLTLPGGAQARWLTVSAGVAYLTDNQNRVHLIDVSAIDVSDPQPSPLPPPATLPSLFYAGNLAVSDRGLLAYASSDGIKLYDVTTPENAQLASTIPYDAGHPPLGLVFTGDVLYAGIAATLGYDMRIKRINVLDPTAPYTMETLMLSATQTAGSINCPVLRNGALVWMNLYQDVLTVAVPER